MLGQGQGPVTGYRNLHFLGRVLPWLILFTAACIHGEPYSPILLEITDPALIGEVWEIAHSDSLPPSGEYQILLNPDPTIPDDSLQFGGEVCLIRNGTEVGRMKREEWETAAANNQKGRKIGWRYVADGAERQEVPVLWSSFHYSRTSLLNLTEWPASLLMELSTSVSALPTTQPQIMRRINFAWSQKVYHHYLLGLEIHRDQFGGGLTRAELERKRLANIKSGSPVSSDQNLSAFWGNAYWGWSLSAGVPGLKYTVSLANQPLPEYFWLETRASKAIADHKAGRVVTQWTGTSLEKPGNLAHTVDARFGYLRYAYHFDQDAYHMAIQTFSMEDMPAPFGLWGTGLVMASSQLATRLWIEIPDLALSLPLPAAYPFNFRLAFLRLDLDYRSLRNFHLGVAVRLRIQNPLLNLPGA